MATVWIDCETQSRVPIEYGTDAYAVKGDARLMIVTWAVDDEPVNVWCPALGERQPHDLTTLLQGNHKFIAHNARFERVLFKHTGLADIPYGRWRCTLAQALAHGLPGALADLCRFLGLPEEQSKLADGKALIKKFCEPPFADPLEHLDDWQRFVEYARQDVAAMRECARRMPSVNYPANMDELKVWFLDQRINDRGFAIDTDLVEKSIELLESKKGELDDAISAVTGGKITAGTQVQRIKQYLAEECGLDVPSLTKDVLAKLNVEGDAATILNIRRDVSRASTAKYIRMRESVVDGRLRGWGQFCGADRTGRWAGRGVQPLNLPRPKMKADEVEAGIEAIKGGWADLVIDSPHALCADALRGTIIAPPGKSLAVADWSAIEGVLLSWIANETWVIDAYREKRDMYIETYCRLFGVPEFDRKDPRRQHGKVLDLASGYEGGVGAQMTMTKTYGVDHVELARAAWHHADADTHERAKWMWDEWAVPLGQTFNLPEHVYRGLQCAKIMWRNVRPATRDLWRALMDAACSAVANTKAVYTAGRCSFMCTGAFLACRLPSGRLLLYARPKLSNEIIRDEHGEPLEDSDGEAKTRRSLTYLDSRGGRRALYGGKAAENICQALGREILVWALPRAEAAGYETVLHVYDEIVAEVPDGKDHEALCELMCVPPPWGQDIPLAAEGFTTARYRKE